MSNLGQAVLIVAGTVVGAYFGNPELGFALGSLAGSALFPTQLPSGPKLTDNRTTTANVGDPVPIVFGTATVAGTVIWLAPFEQHTNKTGKGGPSQTTYSYTQSIAIGLCEAPIDGGQAIAGLTRIWENGTIVFDIRPRQTVDTATGTPAETDTQYANRLAASAAYAETFTLYLGDELQTADPTIEAIEGFGNVPGFRGLAYIVYPNRNLQTAQGWRHPNFTFEVFQAGTGNCTDESLISNDYLAPWNVNAMDPRIAGGTYVYAYIDTATSPVRATIDEAFADAVTAGNALQPHLYGNGASSDPADAVGPSANGSWAFDPTATARYLYFNHLVPTSINYTISPGPCVIIPANPTGMWWWEVVSSSPHVSGRHGIWHWPQPLDSGAVNCGLPDCPAIGLTYDTAIEIYRGVGAPPAPCLGLPDAPIPGYCVRTDGKYVKKGAWVRDDSHVYTYLCLQSTSNTALQYTHKPLNPTIRSTDANNTSAFWTAAYDAAVLAGDMAPGLTYGINYPEGVNHGGSNYAWLIDSQICEGSGGGARIADIITALCARAAVTNIDVTDLVTAGAEVSGYSISSVSTATNCIAPLRSIAFFDAVESGRVLRFQTRGKPIVATLTTDDIGCYDGGQSGNVPPSVLVARVDETTLPRTIRLHYKSVARDYQDAEQSSPFRRTTKAINDQDVSLPFCMGDTQALQCAEILWSDAWAGKSTYTLAIDQSLSEIEVGDAVGIPVDGTLQRARIATEQNASMVLRKLSLLSDNEGAYISFAIAEPSQVKPQRLTLLAGTALELLDLPALQDADSDPGFYLAAQRIGAGNDWRGCVIYKSIDGGSTWATQFSMVLESTAGTLHATPPASEFFTWDTSSEIVVDLASTDFSLESRTDDAVLAGANAAAIGADGRWEILQFATAMQLTATQWKLTRLLRGRRGTEHNIGLSVAGDSFVLLTAGDLSRIILSSAEIGAVRSYDAPSIGATFSSGTVYPFVGHAQALKPFSPVDVIAELLTDGDLNIRWTRRDRLGRTLMSGVDMPLSEATLSFQVDIYSHDSPAATVIRTIASSSTSCLYTAAEQASDFGASPPLTDLRVAVYQLSAVVGRGTPAIQVINTGASP